MKFVLKSREFIRNYYSENRNYSIKMITKNG